MRLALVHTSPPAIAPVMSYYTAEAPELEITNLLDDGILRHFRAGDSAAAEARLRDLLAIARGAYRAEAVMITCSSVPRAMVRTLQRECEVPILKIDDAMAAAAVRAGGRIGVAITFPPTLGPTSRLLEEAANEAGLPVELIPCIVPEAYDALLAGAPERHDELLLAAVEDLVHRPVDAIALAQVSMARLLPKLKSRIAVPVFSSLETSLAALRLSSAARPPDGPAPHGAPEPGKPPAP